MYKVVRKKNRRLVSCVISKSLFSWGGWWTVRYIPHKWVKARKGKLFVCESFDNAKSFLLSERGDEIWECQTKNAKEFPYLSKLLRGMLKEFWKNNESGFERLRPALPTYGADEVKLTKKVWPVKVEKR